MCTETEIYAQAKVSPQINKLEIFTVYVIS